MKPTPPPVSANDSRTDGKAIGSLVCGILSLACFSILTGIPAVILGHLSRSAIRNSMGRLKGERMALGGLILGYISFAIPFILIVAAISIPAFLRSRQAANEAGAVAAVRMINSAEATFKSSKGSGYGNLPSLVSEGLLDNSFLEEKAGYRYSIDASNTDYTAVATPLSSNTARFEYFSTSDAVDSILDGCDAGAKRKGWRVDRVVRGASWRQATTLLRCTPLELPPQDFRSSLDIWRETRW